MVGKATSPSIGEVTTKRRKSGYAGIAAGHFISQRRSLMILLSFLAGCVVGVGIVCVLCKSGLAEDLLNWLCDPWRL